MPIAKPVLLTEELSLSISDDHATIAQLEDLLMLREQILAADAASQKTLNANLQHQYDVEPSEKNKMRLALALTTPGHTRADLIKAQKLIEELQSNTGSLPQVVRMYLRARVDIAKHTYDLEGKVKALSNDTRDLNEQLADVRAQIKALTSIEQKLESARSSASGRERK
ncbi:hypothetical protein CJD38_17775 [Stenotrophobium rhamnosiphilum]|uniref:Uncharacterized protein n=1 Tax=Stenotrophobium rhamnosiphilum TaxID=2029166 RepID=A0A2T5MBB1_9GAMM|nr:hypothetical protein CJD38_17775 [Stenotrophobium rhamnosiphilum]